MTSSRMLMLALIAAAVCVASAGVGAAAWCRDDGCGTTAYIQGAANVGETINFYNQGYKEDVSVGYVSLASNSRGIRYSRSSEPINTILNIKVLDENRNPKPNLDVDLKYFKSWKAISETPTNENGIASFNVSTELLCGVNINSGSYGIRYQPIAIPSGIPSYTYTTYIYALVKNESSIELRNINGTPITNTKINISLNENSIWAGTTDNNGVAIVSGLANNTEYHIDFELPTTYYDTYNSIYTGYDRYFTFTITPHGMYQGRCYCWTHWFDIVPDRIYQPDINAVLEYHTTLPYDELVYTIVNYSTIRDFNYKQSIHHTDQTNSTVQLPSLPTGYYTIFGKIEHNSSISDIQRQDVWIYDSSSYPDYDISISYPSIAANNNLTITIAVISDTEKTISRLVQDNNGYGASWGWYIRPDTTYSEKWHRQAIPDLNGYLNLTVLLCDGPEVWHRVVNDVRAEEIHSPVNLTLNISYNAGGGRYKVCNTNTDENFATIQAAIDDADTNNGDIVTVGAGTYTENVNVYKSLTIESTSGSPEDTIVQAAVSNQNYQNVFTVTADDVAIDGFTIRGASYSWCSGIGLGGKNCIISNNTFEDNALGIWNAVSGIGMYGSGGTIRNNNFSSSSGYYPSKAILLETANNEIEIYLNDFMINSEGLIDNNWNSTEEITHTYKGNTFTSHLGNYWDDYTEKYPSANEIGSTGIWDTPYSMGEDEDSYPLMEMFENYSVGATDTTPPLLTITSPADGATVLTPIITVTGTASDPSGIASVTANGALADGAADWSTWSKDVTLTEGDNTIMVIATDNTGLTTTKTLTITYDPLTAPPSVTLATTLSDSYTVSEPIKIGASVENTGTTPADVTIDVTTTSGFADTKTVSIPAASTHSESFNIGSLIGGSYIATVNLYVDRPYSIAVQCHLLCATLPLSRSRMTVQNRSKEPQSRSLTRWQGFLQAQAAVWSWSSG